MGQPRSGPLTCVWKRWSLYQHSNIFTWLLKVIPSMVKKVLELQTENGMSFASPDAISEPALSCHIYLLQTKSLPLFRRQAIQK